MLDTRLSVDFGSSASGHQSDFSHTRGKTLGFLFKPPSEARGFVLNLTGDLCNTFAREMIENDQKRSFGDHEIKRLSGGLRKKFGGAKRPARTAREDGCDGKKRFTIFAPRFGPYLRHTFGFFQKK